MHILVVSTPDDRASASSTLRSAARVVPAVPRTVLDLSGRWPGTDDDVQVLGLDDLPVERAELHAAAIELDSPDLRRWATLVAVQHLVTDRSPVLVVGAGVEILTDPTSLTTLLDDCGLVLVPWASVPPTDDALPGAQDLIAGSLFTELLTVWGRGAALDQAVRVARDWRTAYRTLEIVAAGHRHGLADPEHSLLSVWNLGGERHFDDDGVLRAEGRPVMAADFTALDPERPWAWDPRHPTWDRALLSDHPAVAARAAEVARGRRSSPDCRAPGLSQPFAATSLGLPVHPQLRALYRSAPSTADLPDPFTPDGAAALRTWLLEPVPEGHPAPLARYLAEVYAARPDLQHSFPLVPGQDTDALLRWAVEHGTAESEYDPGLLREAADRSRDAARPAPRDPAGPPRDGVAVVGYLTGELGVGESARLMLGALAAGDIPHVAVPVVHQLQSRHTSRYVAPETADRFTTTLYCVNSDQTPGLVRALHGRYDDTYRIGMWYWEVEDFPTAQHVGFEHVDEIWTATDFVREAIAPHTALPVHTVPPPLPQRPTGDRPRFDLPGVTIDRPVLLFSFDFLSNAERKNPWAVVDAFRQAFSPDEGPVLVIKSINAARDVPSAERLRLMVAGRPDVILLEDYLDQEERDALMARCDAYVSLHRSEGLGLTLAEAMSWGRPVIATAYSGNLQFMTPENSILVPWTPVPVPERCDPYPAGTTWAEPDIGATARAMRRVVDEPRWAAQIGARAAADIRELHSPAAAARTVTARLSEITRTLAGPEPTLGRRPGRWARRALRQRT